MRPKPIAVCPLAFQDLRPTLILLLARGRDQDLVYQFGLDL
jgi:hypothetical protein